MTIHRVVMGAALSLLIGSPVAAQTPPPPPQTPPQQSTEPQKPPTVKETVVVSASKTEEQLVNAPATMSVVDPASPAIGSSTNYADILRSVPGLNITQISARDVNVTSRGATSSLATSQLTLLDGRSLYQDFFGFTMWDFMPVNVNDIKRIEVVRGPASAVWGANAMSGVVNVITKTPRENPGTTVTVGAGRFPRDVFGHAATTGYLSYLNGSKAGALNDRWAYRVSMGLFLQDALARPTGVIPGSPTAQTYPPFANHGTSQPKMDARVDYDFPDGERTLSMSGGYAETSGIMHTGIGPFSIGSGSIMTYGKVNYARKAFHVQGFLNVLDGNAANLLTVGPAGNPILMTFTTKTFDLEAGDTRVAAAKHVVTYGGNLRINRFALTIAPGEDHRTEGGAYLQDEFVATEQFRIVAGARVDKFSSIDKAVLSPRLAFVVKPHPDHSFRVSYNRAFRAPSMVNNNLQITIANPLPLSVIGQPGIFLVPTDAAGNPNLKQEHVDAYELSYTGVIQGRTTVSVAGYFNDTNNEILFTETAEWPLTTPPPGWLYGGTAWGAVQSSAHFPQSFTYLNLGREKNKGVELGVDSNLVGGASVYANYSYQALPKTNFPLSETNHPSRHRFNAGVSYTDDRWVAGLSVSSATEAFWQDVLDARFSGTTPAWTITNGSAGVKFGTDARQYQATLKVTNMFNRDMQQHIFGDVIKRQIVVEVRVSMK